jgi:hypothetical protein
MVVLSAGVDFSLDCKHNDMTLFGSLIANVERRLRTTVIPEFWLVELQP